jgi:3-methyl-2-oxobutanoate hydroxymethyltransferase
MGGFKVQGRHEAEAIAMLEDAQRLQEAGCFSMVLEGIPADLAARITETVKIPTIGIGAGPHCSGQVLVFHDVLGLLPGASPKFVRRYAEGFEELRAALGTWAEDVRGGGFPDERESYTLPEAVRPALSQWHP